ncbi:unnamed protein product [Effrenium voratum]|uniref:Uncharacterized protein n=1 Tax=Effrenium voratum TaxID=2562239 RepID=A0AA36NAD9_9DINO|nr:unnamed protein product [Effrenium voratum]
MTCRQSSTTASPGSRPWRCLNCCRARGPTARKPSGELRGDRAVGQTHQRQGHRELPEPFAMGGPVVRPFLGLRPARYFLDTPKPNAKSVSWTAWGRGGKPFRWHRPADSKGEAAEKAEEPLKPRPKAMPRSTQAPPEPKIPKMLQPKPKILPQKVPEPKSMPEQPKKRTSSHPWRGEKQPAKQPRQEEPQAEPAKDADAKDADAKDADAKASPAGKSNAPSQVKASNPETTGWEKERIIARSILVRGFRPDPDKEDALSEPEEAREELVAADPAVKQEADSSTGVGELPMSE